MAFKKDLLRAAFWSLILLLAVNISTAHAQTLQELQDDLAQKNEEIRKLEGEAKKFREEVALRQKLGKTLKEELDRISKAILKLRNDIKLTETRIEKKKIEIKQTTLEINDKEARLKKLKSGLAELILSLAKREEKPMVAVLAENRALSDFFQQIEYSQNLNQKILDTADTLRGFKKELEVKKAEAQEKKAEFENLKSTLQQNKKVQENTQAERTDLLRTTKNEEKKYQELVRDREAKRIALEEEVRDIESKIKFTFDPSLLPSKGRGVLGWPLENIFLSSCKGSLEKAINCITQFFGYTSFAARGAYRGEGHNGVDFRAAQGTQVTAAYEGTIKSVGDTDRECRRVSYGKWILIEHPNNLTTLYAHLSLVKVIPGQTVKRGEEIAYSGATGYATGPHLHLGVFAAKAVEVQQIRSRVCGRTITMPIAAINGYLNPLDYL